MTSKEPKPKKPVKEKVARKAPAKSKAKPILFKCDFCSVSFVKEETLMDHTCTNKQRWLRRDDRDIDISFRAYQLFYKEAMRAKKDKTKEEFVKSPYFNDFHRFGKFLIDMNVVNPSEYTKWLIKGDAKVKDWTNSSIYELWTRELTANEQPLDAAARNVLLMEQWSIDHDEPWQDFFKKVSPVLATSMIRNGRLSPWILYSVGEELIARFSDEQLNMIREWIDPIRWKVKIRNNQQDFIAIQEIFSNG